EASFQQEVRERLPGELIAMRGLEGVANVEVVDDGIHLTSEPVTLVHEGVRYPMGTFTVRLDPEDCSVEAWNDDPLHPDGHHHPHVANKSLACYGNIGLALTKALAAYRYLDAATIAMRWLWTYSASTTLYKIEEWPSEDAKAATTEVKHVEII